MNDAFTHLLRVRYAECDAQQVVFNGKYVEYIDVAFTEFSRVVWGDYKEMLKSGLDSQVVSLHIDWKAPAHFDDVLAIRMKTAHIGNTSYSLEVDFSNHADGTSVASAKIVYVMVSATQHQKVTIPENFKSALENGAPGVVVDHSGAV